jgi:transposase
MHDNDPKHTADVIKDRLIQRRIQILPWPPYSPDFNPIEQLWDELERRLQKHHPKNRQELVNVLMDEWNKVEPRVLEKFVDSVPSRLYECVRAKSYPTKY